MAFLLPVLFGAVVAVASDPTDHGRIIYMQKCAGCHGERGEGKGELSEYMGLKASSFHDSKLWQADAIQVIVTSVKNGKGTMSAVRIKPEDAMDVANYMKQAFGSGGE